MTKIPDRFIPEIKESMLEAALTVKVNSGGISNENAVIVNTVTDFVGTDKDFYITGNFSLAANLTLPEGARLIENGGNLSLNGFDLNGTDLSFYSPDNRTFITIGTTGTINNSATYSNANVILEWFDVIGDWNSETNLGTDNRNTLLQVAKIVNNGDGNLHISRSLKYGYSLVLSTVQPINTPSNLYFTNGSSLSMVKGAAICAISNALGKFEVLEIWNATGGKFQGTIYGDWKTHDYVTAVNSEACHGLVIGSGNKDIVIEFESYEAPGYACTGRFTPEFYHLNQVIEANFTKDFTIDGSGTPVADTDFAYSIPFSVSNASFQTFGLQLTGGSFGGTGNMKSQLYQIAWCNGASFVSKSNWQETYKSIPIPTGVDNVVIIIETPAVWANLLMTIGAPTHSKNVYIQNSVFKNGANQGFSNPSPGTYFYNCKFYENGRYPDGSVGTPGYGMDSEDAYQGLNQITFDKCYFGDNKGGAVIVKGGRDITIKNTEFPFPVIPNYTNIHDINFGNAERGKLIDITARGWNIELGRRSIASRNNLINSNIVFSLEGEKFTDNHLLENIRFHRVATDIGTGLAYISNNKVNYTRPLNSTDYVFSSLYNVVWKNNLFDFNGYSYNTTTHKLTNMGSIGNEAKGSIDDLTIINLDSELYDGTLQWWVMDINKLNIFTSFDFRGGTAKDWKLTNSNIYGRLHLTLNDFPATDAGEFKTFTVENTNIIPKDPSIDLQFTVRAINTPAKDVNFIMKGGSVVLISGDRFFNMLNYGSKRFEGVTFQTGTALSTLALDSTYEFIDCDFINIEFTGAKILFTKVSLLMATYATFADETAANAAEYPSGYLYMTVTGEPKIKL
jgi:hypothetical protein